jgi:hypothetical protein
VIAVQLHHRICAQLSYSAGGKLNLAAPPERCLILSALDERRGGKHVGIAAVVTLEMRDGEPGDISRHNAKLAQLRDEGLVTRKVKSPPAAFGPSGMLTIASDIPVSRASTRSYA